MRLPRTSTRMPLVDSGHQKYFDRDLAENLKLIDAGLEGTSEFELLLDEKFSNPNGRIRSPL